MEAQVIWGMCRNLALSPQTSCLYWCRRMTFVQGRQRDRGARERLSGLGGRRRRKHAMYVRSGWCIETRHVGPRTYTGVWSNSEMIPATANLPTMSQLLGPKNSPGHCRSCRPCRNPRRCRWCLTTAWSCITAATRRPGHGRNCGFLIFAATRCLNSRVNRVTKYIQYIHDRTWSMCRLKKHTFGGRHAKHAKLEKRLVSCPCQAAPIWYLGE